MGWRVSVLSALLFAGSFGKPSLLGIAPNTNGKQHEMSNNHHDHHFETHDYDYYQLHEEASMERDSLTLNGLYSAPREDITQSKILYEAPDSTPNASNMQMDPSYYFEVKSSDSERVEDADSNGNIVGSYGFNTPGGTPVEVKYKAGADTGFIIENMSELLAAAEAASREDNLLYAKPYTGEKVEINFRQPVVDPASMHQDSSYSYGYSAKDIRRQESSDSVGNVRGSYRYVATDGTLQEIHYRAGADTGFVVISEKDITGDHGLPSNKDSLDSIIGQVPELLYEPPPEDIIPLDVEYPNKMYNAPSDQAYLTDLAASQYEKDGDILPNDGDFETTTMMMDKSYNFGYSGDEATRLEEADPSGVVHGQYSYFNAEGNEIVVKYKAGADIGFVIENEEELNSAVQKATFDGSVAAIAAKRNLDDSKFLEEEDSLASSSAYFAPEESFPNGPSSYSPTTVISNDPMQMDASFSYQVNEVDHTFEEESDRTGERRGSYTYIDPQGRQVEVRYSAGRGGYVILNPDDVFPRSHLS